MELPLRGVHASGEARPWILCAAAFVARSSDRLGESLRCKWRVEDRVGFCGIECRERSGFQTRAGGGVGEGEEVSWLGNVVMSAKIVRQLGAYLLVSSSRVGGRRRETGLEGRGLPGATIEE